MEVSEPFLRQMNGLGADEEPPVGRMLLVEYSVELSDGATLNELAQFFGMPLAHLLEVNQLADNDAVRPGQRFEIPIGDRFREAESDASGRNSEVQVYEVTFQPGEIDETN